MINSKKSLTKDDLVDFDYKKCERFRNCSVWGVTEDDVNCHGPREGTQHVVCKSFDWIDNNEILGLVSNETLNFSYDETVKKYEIENYSSSYSLQNVAKHEMNLIKKMEVDIESAYNEKNPEASFNDIVRIMRCVFGKRRLSDDCRALGLKLGLEELLIVYAKCTRSVKMRYKNLCGFLELNSSFVACESEEQVKLWNFSNWTGLVFDNGIIKAKNNKNVLVFALGMVLG